jgi:uncharacterized membrane protein YdbT with pleckstrin-like domain
MGYVDKNLLSRESVVFRGRLHWNVYVVPVFITALSLFVAYWGATQKYNNVALGFFVAAAASILFPYVRAKTSEFVVTDKRIIMKVGILGVRTLEMFLNKVENIGVNQTIWGRMFNFGEVTVTGSGGTKEVFGNIARPYEFRKAAQEQISQSV